MIILQAAFAMGDRVRDRISGWTGIVIGCTHWLNGCIRYGVQKEKLQPKEGKFEDVPWFDEQQLELVKRGAFNAETKPTGGPRNNPKFPVGK